MVKTLFDEDGRFYNEFGLELSDEIKKALEPILIRWIDNGFNAGEIRGFPATMTPLITTGATMRKWCRDQELAKQSQSNMESIPEGCCYMTIDEFVKSCKFGSYVDDDGSGYYATSIYYMPNKPAIPSEIHSGQIDYNFTHVVWFDK